jgi:hypothetical protein
VVFRFQLMGSMIQCRAPSRELESVRTGFCVIGIIEPARTMYAAPCDGFTALQTAHRMSVDAVCKRNPPILVFCNHGGADLSSPWIEQGRIE